MFNVLQKFDEVDGKFVLTKNVSLMAEDVIYIYEIYKYEIFRGIVMTKGHSLLIDRSKWRI